MSCIVYQTNPKTGIKYAYESVSYWDKEKKQPRSRRKYLGRVNPETGEIIPSPRKKPVRANAGDRPEPVSPDVLLQLREELSMKNAQVTRLQAELDSLSAQLEKTEGLLKNIRSLISAHMEGTHV